MGDTFAHSLGPLLKDNTPFIIDSNKNRGDTVKPLGIFSRIYHFKDAKFHQARLSSIALKVAELLAQQKRMSAGEAANDPLLRTAKDLLKHINQIKVTDSAIQKLSLEVTAAKVGITSSALLNNPGLEKFILTTHLEGYLKDYNDELREDLETHEVLIRKDNEYIAWSEISEEIQEYEKTAPKREPRQPWLYGQRGVQNKDMYDWTELTPYKIKDPAEWDYQYILEVCACHNPTTIKTGNHCWIRLKTPKGEIYSIGLYRPDKLHPMQNLTFPLRIKPGNLMQPDVSEFWPYKIYTIETAIDEKDFLKMKAQIEADKRDQNLVFQLFNNNCLLYCKRIASLANIELPTSETIAAIAIPQKMQERVQKILKKLPYSLQKLCIATATLFFNFFQVALGASKIDSHLNANQKSRAVAHITCFKDLFDPQKTVMNHPNTLAFKTRELVQNWRQKKIDRFCAKESDVGLRNKKIKEIKYKLPKSFYTRSR